jgi:hypothetical protein
MTTKCLACRKKTSNPRRPLFVPLDLKRLIHGRTFLAHPIDEARIRTTSDPRVVLPVASCFLIVDEVEQQLQDSKSSNVKELD